MTERMTAEMLRATRKRNREARMKGHKSAVVGKEAFHSRREARRWIELQMLEKAGEIRDLKRQVPINLQGQSGPILTPTGRKMRYIADFTYTDTATGLEVIEDAKGHPSDTYQMKRAIVAAMGLTIREV